MWLCELHGNGAVTRLVRVRDDERALLRKGVRHVGDDLHRRVGLTRPRRPDDNRQAWVHRAAQRLHLCTHVKTVQRPCDDRVTTV